MELNPLMHKDALEQDAHIDKIWEQTPTYESRANRSSGKKMYFHSFPQSWQQQLIQTGQYVANTQLLDMI
jgi:hypothetical protein